MSALIRRFRPGDVIPGDKHAPGGEVVTFRDLSPTRQWLSVRGPDRALRTTVVELGPPGARPMVEAVEPAEARALAIMILAGEDPRLAVTHQINVLAGAVLALTEPPAPPEATPRRATNGGTP